MINNKITDVVAKPHDSRIIKVSKNSQQNNSETISNKNDEKLPKERYISPEERQKVIDNLIFNIIV